MIVGVSIITYFFDFYSFLLRWHLLAAATAAALATSLRLALAAALAATLGLAAALRGLRGL